jgi:pimeloyl-ACP methyl ester carboxylesterase
VGRCRPALATDHLVVRIDLIGHGGTAAPGSGYSIERQGALVSAILDQLGVDRVTVIGHSMGGEVATALAELNPERIERLIFIDSPPIAGRISYASREFTGEHNRYHYSDHYDDDRYYPRRPIRREQLPLAQGERKKTDGRDHDKDSSSRSIALSKSCAVRWHIQLLSMREEVQSC